MKSVISKKKATMDPELLSKLQDVVALEDATTKVDSINLNSHRESQIDTHRESQELTKVDESDQSDLSDSEPVDPKILVSDIQNKAKALLRNFIVNKHFAFSPNNELIIGS